jgi:hypothetical protein
MTFLFDEFLRRDTSRFLIPEKFEEGWRTPGGMPRGYKGVLRMPEKELGF